MNVLMKFILTLALAAPLAAAPAQAAIAPTPAATAAAPVIAPVATIPIAATTPVAADAKTPAVAKAKDGSLPGYTPMKPTPGIGMPQSKEVNFQEQFTENGDYANRIDGGMLWVIGAISLFVLGLLFIIIVRFRASANPVPSKTTHNTWIEVLWTLIPVFILLGMAYPSLDLLAKQFKPAPKDAVTIKITGYQWYWGYTYPDNGGFEVVSNLLKEQSEVGAGERFRTDADGPQLLAVDARMVVPAGVPLRIQTTAADVIHAFAVPSLWFKLDAVPGRLNEKSLTITKPGVYFGQCSELCGASHGYMPIAVEALPPAKFAAWVKAQGGTMPNDKTPGPNDKKTEAAAAMPAAAPVINAPNSAIPPVPAAAITK